MNLLIFQNVAGEPAAKVKEKIFFRRAFATLDCGLMRNGQSKNSRRLAGPNLFKKVNGAIPGQRRMQHKTPGIAAPVTPVLMMNAERPQRLSRH